MTLNELATAWSGAAGQPRAWIAERIPHQGEMCLLTRVVSAAPSGVICTSDSHLSQTNPLRVAGELGAASGIEYAAQAMALHGALLADHRGVERSKMGFLVSVRAVECHVLRLDDVPENLTVAVSCEADNGDHCVYEFGLTASGRPLVEGRAMVMLSAPPTFS